MNTISQPGVLDLTVQAILLMLKVSLPPIIVASIVGLIISFFQAVTQLQEQTLAFSVKLISVVLVILLTANWLGGELLHFIQQIFTFFWHTRG